MPITATVTGKIGPALQLTTAVFSGLTEIRINTDQMTLQMFRGGQALDSIDLTATTTLTGSITGSTSTVAISIT